VKNFSISINFKSAAIICALILFFTSSKAQLTPSDSTYLSLLNKELTLTAAQTNSVDSILKVTTSSIQSLDKELSRISRSDLLEEEKSLKQAEIKEKKKLLKDNKELSIQLLLTVDQKKLYDEKIKPSKPGVLHMGMNHDRANCTVCLPK
jgi:hypothetical protein